MSGQTVPDERESCEEKEYENGIVFHTGSMKDLYTQITANPKAELCFFSKGVQVACPAFWRNRKIRFFAKRFFRTRREAFYAHGRKTASILSFRSIY